MDMELDKIRPCSENGSKDTEHTQALPELAQGGPVIAGPSGQPEESAPTVHRYRNAFFHHDYEPFRGHQHLRARTPNNQAADRAPDDREETTNVELAERRQPQIGGVSSVADNPNVEFKWSSRDNRKGRHALIVRESDERANPYQTPPSTRRARHILRGLYRMVTVWPRHNTSHLLAVIFSVACTMLLVVGILSFLPSIRHSFKSSRTLFQVEAIFGAVGCTLFAIGSTISFSEAVNVNRRGCFGWKLVQIENPSTDASAGNADPSVEKSYTTKLVPDGSCSHSHDSYRTVSGHPRKWSDAVAEGRADSFRPQDPADRTKTRRIWVPSWSEVRHHLIYDFGFVCASILAASSLLYCGMAWTAVAYTYLKGEGAHWIRIPQIVAASGFMLSCLLAMVETQRNWWRPSPWVLGWQANMFNVAGSVGFLLAAVTGYMHERWWWAPFHLGCSYFWGAIAFLVGSLIQWYEALDKYPVKHVKAKKK